MCCRDLELGARAGLRSLAEKNLVLPEADGRFGMLETIRELAGERLAAGGEEPAIRGAHARWYLAMAEEGGPNRRGAERAAWLDRVGRERENLRAALAWAGAGGDVETALRLAAGLAPFWIAHGLIDEGKRSLAAVLAGPREPSLGRARALSVAGFLRMLEGDLEGGERACRESLTLSGSGEEWYRAVALNVLGTAARYRGRWEEARRLYGEALALATAEDLWWPAALAQANLGALAGLEGRHAEAVERHEQAVAHRARGGRRVDGRGLPDERRACRPAAGRPRSCERPAGRGAAQLRRARERLGHRRLRRRVRHAGRGSRAPRPGGPPLRRRGGDPGAGQDRALAHDPRRARGRHGRRRRPRSARPPGRVRGPQGRALTQDEAIAEATRRSACTASRLVSSHRPGKEDRMPAVTTQDGVSIAYASAGEGPPHLLFMHGWAGSGRYFDATIEHLDLTRLCAVTFDLRGHRESDPATDGVRARADRGRRAGRRRRRRRAASSSSSASA